MIQHGLMTQLLAGLGLLLLLPLLDQRRAAHRIPLLTLAIGVLLLYGHWRCSATVDWTDWSAQGLWQLGFLTVEMLALIYTVWSLVVLYRRRDRWAAAVNGEDRLRRRGQDVPSIVIFIPTVNEPPEVVEPTIAAAAKIAYPRLSVQVLDDGRRDWVADCCRRHGIGYRTRTDSRHAKGGNLDAGLRATSSDLVGCIDIDFRAFPTFAYRMAALLEDPAIGLVQAPQHFRNADPVQRNLGGSEAWTEEQRFFFDVALPARDAWGNSLCVGSCWLARREIFQRHGGFPVGTVAEDIVTGYVCKSAGYQTAYLDEPVALGLAPEDLPAYISQRTRWSQGAMQILQDRNGPFRLPGLSLLDRVFYFDVCFFWFGHLVLLAVLLAPLAYGFLGWPAFTTDLDGVVERVVPRLLIPAIVFAWISQGRVLPIITPVKKYLTLWYVLPAMLHTALRPRGRSFKVTAKGQDTGGSTIHWHILAPYGILLLLTLLAVGVTYTHSYTSFAWSDYTAINLALAGYNLTVLFLCCLCCVERPPTPAEADGPQYITGSARQALTALWRRIWT